MISLEALKSSMLYLKRNVDKMRSSNGVLRDDIISNNESVVLQFQDLTRDRSAFLQRREALFDDCAYSQHELDDESEALILYC